MAEKRSRYQQLEHFLTMLLFLDLGMFVLYLITAGFGILVLKILFAILVFLLCALCLWLLHRTKELFRSRSLWLTCGFGSMLLLTVVSLICNFPSPK